MLDVLFFTHATAETGFGHAARTSHLARLLITRDERLRMGVEGAFTPGARSFLAAAGVGFAEPEALARVGVYDRMDDSQDPEHADPGALEAAHRRCDRMVFMANGITRPALPAGVITIGYKPGGPPPSPPDLYWGLNYAPVAGDMLPKAPPAREPGRALVALGGAGGADAVHNVLVAISEIAVIDRIDVLDSPLTRIDVAGDWVRPDQALDIHRGVAQVTPFLADAAVVVANYGHLAYEALACRAPLCLVGLKRFQADYAARLAASGLCVAAGLLDELDRAELKRAVRETLLRARELSAAAGAAVDGRGLDRITGLILGLCRKG